MIWKGYRNPVEQKDLWHLDPKMTSRGIVPKFNRYYSRSIEASKVTGKPHSVIPAIIFAFGPSFVKASINKLFCDVLLMVNPQIMSYMITHVEMKAKAETDDEVEFYAWRGYFYAVLMFGEHL